METSLHQRYPLLANSPADRLAALEALCRSKVAEVLQAYLNGEADELIRRRRYERAEEGAPVLYRNGHDPERLRSPRLAGAFPFCRPRVRGTTYESAVLPKHVRRLPSLDRTFHKLWLEGLSQRDFEPALRALLGEAAPLSASTIARGEPRSSARSSMLGKRVGSITSTTCTPSGRWRAPGRRVSPTSGVDSGCAMGADAQGEKHPVALDEAMSESEMSWREIMHDLKARGLRAPRLAVADGANGFWAALSAEYPEAGTAALLGAQDPQRARQGARNTQGRGAPQVA